VRFVEHGILGKDLVGRGLAADIRPQALFWFAWLHLMLLNSLAPCHRNLTARIGGAGAKKTNMKFCQKGHGHYPWL
jgi:hypothetical protein